LEPTLITILLSIAEWHKSPQRYKETGKKQRKNPIFFQTAEKRGFFIAEHFLWDGRLLNLAAVLLGLPIVANSDKEDVAYD
jgi:hypothetical protein